MADIFETTVICDECNNKTTKIYVIREGFKIRAWKCEECNKEWLHPEDKNEYDTFLRLKNKRYVMKLRLVGNSYTVSIPREIVEFEEEFQREFDRLIQMSLEEPEKLTLFFRRKLIR